MTLYVLFFVALFSMVFSLCILLVEKKELYSPKVFFVDFISLMVSIVSGILAIIFACEEFYFDDIIEEIDVGGYFILLGLLLSLILLLLSRNEEKLVSETNSTAKTNLIPNGWICENCKAINPKHFISCEKCGVSKLNAVSDSYQEDLKPNAVPDTYQKKSKSDVWVCRKCGATNPSTSRLCENCRH